MGGRQIRIGQLIAPFGPGSIYTDRRGTPHVICGLDHWYERWDPVQGLLACESPAEYERFEPRLAALLRVNRFRSPPDFRAVRRGQVPPPNAMLHVPALRFPRWHRHTKTGGMRRFNLETARLDVPPGGGRWVPVRFVAVCANGHLCEFPWREWIECQCPSENGLIMTDRGGPELSSIRIECRTCPPNSTGRKGRSLSGTTVRPEGGEQSAFGQAGITCPGDRPWLGEGAQEAACAKPLIGAFINQTNLYFPMTISAILLPDIQLVDADVATLRNEIEEEAAICGVAKTLWNMGSRSGAVALVKSSLQERRMDCADATLEAALESLFTSSSTFGTGAGNPGTPESEMLAFRRAEFNILREEINEPGRIPNLRVIQSVIPGDLTPWLSRVRLVERLRETRVLYGFDRLEQRPQPLSGMPDSAMRVFFRSPPDEIQERWLPAVEVYGEGIYLELSEERILEWQTAQAPWLDARLNDRFIAQLGALTSALPPRGAAGRDWASRYLLVHSFAHLLINQLVFECGYGTASLRERLYVSADAIAPMAGILIYTAAGDSEGTMGGLVRLGRPEHLGPVVRRALSRASWCSADPVCSESLRGRGSKSANLAACHGCILLPETCCETMNQGLDRAMVVGTAADRAPGIMAELLENMYTLE